MSFLVEPASFEVVPELDTSCIKLAIARDYGNMLLTLGYVNYFGTLIKPPKVFWYFMQVPLMQFLIFYRTKHFTPRNACEP